KPLVWASAFVARVFWSRIRQAVELSVVRRANTHWTQLADGGIAPRGGIEARRFLQAPAPRRRGPTHDGVGGVARGDGELREGNHASLGGEGTAGEGRVHGLHAPINGLAVGEAGEPQGVARHRVAQRGHAAETGRSIHVRGEEVRAAG